MMTAQQVALVRGVIVALGAAVAALGGPLATLGGGIIAAIAASIAAGEKNPPPRQRKRDKRGRYEAPANEAQARDPLNGDQPNAG